MDSSLGFGVGGTCAVRIAQWPPFLDGFGSQSSIKCLDFPQQPQAQMNCLLEMWAYLSFPLCRKWGHAGGCEWSLTVSASCSSLGRAGPGDQGIHRGRLYPAWMHWLLLSGQNQAFARLTILMACCVTYEYRAPGGHMGGGQSSSEGMPDVLHHVTHNFYSS